MATRLLEQYKWTKDGRKWVFYDWTVSLDGKRKKYFSPAYRTKKEALEAEREFMGSFRIFSYDITMTFKDLYTAFYEYQEDKVKATTLSTYKDRIKYMQILDKIKLKDLNIQHYELWKKEVNKVNISTRYKNHIHKFIKIVLNFGIKIYGCNFSQLYSKMVKFTNHNEIAKEMDFYTLDEFKTFISCEDDLKFKCLYETLYFCGLRKGEARALTWNDIDFDEKTLKVNKNVVSVPRSGESFSITTPKTSSSVRLLPIPDILLNDLKTLLKNTKIICGYNYNWFIFGYDTPISDHNIRVHKNKLCKKAEVKQIRIHDFRHSCASLLINNGANITIVAKYLGHTKIDETLNTYSHMFKNKLNDIVDTINKLT